MLPIINTIRVSNMLNTCYNTLLNGSRSNFLAPQLAMGYKTRTLEERLGIPDRPKKPLTPFFRFLKEIRPAYMAANQGSHVKEFLKFAGKKWEVYDEKKKLKFQETFKTDQIDYLKTIAEYEKTLTEDQKNNLSQLKQEIADGRVRLAHKKKLQQLGRPTRPAPPYFQFMNSENAKNTRDPNEPYKVWHLKTTEKWNKMLEAEKEIYNSDYKKKSTKYKEDIVKWEEKMVTAGEIDCLRTDTKIEKTRSKMLHRNADEKAASLIDKTHTRIHLRKIDKK